MAREREHSRKSPRGRSDSPVRERGSSLPHRRSSPQREKSPVQRNSSSSRHKATVTHGSSHTTRSPPREKVKDSPSRREMSRSPSPINKRLRRAQVEQDMEKQVEKDNRKNSSKEQLDRRRRREREDGKDEAEKHAERDFRRISSRDEERVERERGRHRERGDGRGEVEKPVERGHQRNLSREDRDTWRHREQDDRRDSSRDRRADRERHDRRDRSVSPEEHDHRGRRGSRSPHRAPRDGDRDEDARSRSTLVQRDNDHDSLAQMNAAAEALEAKEKQKPSFELSGKLAEETNKVKGVTLLHNEPPEARKPDIRWRLYIFKGGEVLNEPLYVHRTSYYLFGRERRVVDIPTDHPSCSKQHAVLQYRLVEKEQPDAMMAKQVRPYLMDLGSTNGTFLNDNRIEPQRYYELFEKDTIKFGNSSREYVLLHENSAG